MNIQHKQRLKPMPFIDVVIDDIFWAPRIRMNREYTIPHIYKKLKETGRIEIFKLEWKLGKEQAPFWESDVAKWIEAGSYAFATKPDTELGALLDKVVNLIISAQQPDGYLNIYFTIVAPEKRLTHLRDYHELYQAGHLIESAVAHYQATGKRNFLDSMCRLADFIDRLFGTEEGKRRGYCGHPEIELALVRLYRVTGEKRYLNLSRFFIDERGRQPHYFDIEARARGEDPRNLPPERTYEYNQSHKPVREQREVVGHTVRAMYLYSAMTDLADEFGDGTLLSACRKLWEHLCLKRMYITGGIGVTYKNEGSTFDYDLPSETAYCETCAGIGLVFWNHRLLHIDLNSRYADIIERALYNGVLSGISMDGKKFFYENPLASLGKHHRQEWFWCACCPPNIARLLASLGQYIYSQNKTDAIVHLYIQGSGRFNFDGKPVILRQETKYPWDGRVTIHVEIERPVAFCLKLRLPGWCRKARFWVNEKPVSISDKLTKGYVSVYRNWNDGDKVVFDMSMPIERVHAHPNVRQNVGCVALQRGPLIYCLEEVDNKIPLHRICLAKDSKISYTFKKDLLGGIGVITDNAKVVDDTNWKKILYQPQKERLKPFKFTAIPYYAWDNRNPGQMLVWIREKI